MGDTSIKMLERSSGGGLSTTMVLIALGILLLLVILTLWHRYGTHLEKVNHPDEAGRRHPMPRKADHLFLSVRYGTDPALPARDMAFLRTLTMERASFVASDSRLNKGNLLDLHLGDLPGGTGGDSDSIVRGRVVRKKSLGGVPESWLVDIKFTEKGKPDSLIIRDAIRKACHGDRS